MAKQKNKGGRLAANFRRANIAEGLAIQMFRPFSAISPVPREEDYGIDFIGTLIKKEGRVLTAEDSFLVQIKTATSPIFSFSGDGIEWLRNLKLPYFPVVADLNLGKVSIYTLNSFHFPLFTSIVNTYNFVVQNDHNEGDGLDDFPLGDPILEWSLTDCINPGFAEWAYNVFIPFVRIEANNFRYGKLWRFEQFNAETYRFDSSNSIKSPLKIPIEIMEISPGDGEVIQSTLRAVIGPFANWASNQIYKGDKSSSLLKLREALRELDFDPDPENHWDEIAEDMKD